MTHGATSDEERETIPEIETIGLRGVRTHNLQNLTVDIPIGRITVVTGPSGSGKSSLAFDTLYAEGQRRYVESLSAYTRQFLERMDRPDVEGITGIPPAIAVERKPPAKSSRSTVGTVTEILDYVRMLYARVGTLRCLGCDREVRREQTTDAVDRLLSDHATARATIVFPIVREAPSSTPDALRRRGYYRLTSDGSEIVDLHEGTTDLPPDGALYAVADRLRLNADQRSRLAESLDAAFHEGHDRAAVFVEGEGYVPLSRGFHCAHCDRAYDDPSPLSFSFNSPMGACPRCRGFGDIIDIDPERVVPDPTKTIAGGVIAPWQSGSYRKWQRKLMTFAKENDIPTDRPWSKLSKRHQKLVFEGGKGFTGVRGFFSRLEEKIYKLHVRVLLSRYRRYVTCDECGGARLRSESLAFRIGDRSIAEVCEFAVADSLAFFGDLALTGQARETAEPLTAEIVRRLDVMVRAGLDYLSLDRPSRTLSGGEYQRIRLATALGSGLTGTLYVLDEPSVGLHARDSDRLLSILTDLRDEGNTVVVVEHDRDLIARSDHVLDLGPGAGEHGGQLVYAGDPGRLKTDAPGLTGEYMSGRRTLPEPSQRDLTGARRIGVRGATAHNLKNVDADIPLGGLVCVSGVSGSGKSSLVQETLYNGYRRRQGEAEGAVGAHRGLTGLVHIHDIVLVDQSPIGRTPRSNPVTYMKAFDGIRKLFAGTAAARGRGLEPGAFSFNVAGGRCEACEGAGQIRIELQFLADLFVTCEACGGRRYGDAVLAVHYRGKSIHDVLQMTISEAVDFFADTPPVSRSLWHLEEVGLGYLRLGQPATTLSGGEAQRLKIALHLSRKVRGTSVFILDEPTTGLHVADIAKLLTAFDRLIHRGHTVLVVEHNLDVLARADWILDLGPEGGAGGGELVAEGPPQAIAAEPRSITGRYLADYFARWGKTEAPKRRAKRVAPAKRKARRR